MELVVKPEPTPEEEEAIARALARVLDDRATEIETAWRREAVRENVELEGPEVYSGSS